MMTFTPFLFLFLDKLAIFLVNKTFPFLIIANVRNISCLSRHMKLVVFSNLLDFQILFIVDFANVSCNLNPIRQRLGAYNHPCKFELPPKNSLP